MTLISLLTWPLLTFPMACKDPTTSTTTYIELAQKREAVSIQAIPNNSNKKYLMVKVVDAMGFPVPNEAVSLMVDGNTHEMQTDAFGIATYAVDSLNAKGTATWNGMTVNVAYTEPSEALMISGYNARYIPSKAQSYFSAKTSGGSLFAKDQEIWWLSDQRNALAHAIATLDDAILGLESGHIDNDGILDAVVWTAKEAYFLRGNRLGGFSLGTQYSVVNDASTLVAASISLLDSGNRGDVALATSTESTSAVIVLEGDGVWNFTQRAPLLQQFPIESMSASDENGDGWTDISVINANDGTLRRFAYSIAGWTGGFPSRIDASVFTTLSGSYLAPTRDLNGDGILDIIVYDGVGSTTQDLVFFTIADTITKFGQEYGPYYADTFDGDNNGYDEIFALSENKVHWTYLQSGNNFSAHDSTGPSKIGPVEAYDSNDDDIVDLQVLYEHPIEVTGSFAEAQAGSISKWMALPTRWKEDMNAVLDTEHLVVGNTDGNASNIEVAGIIDSAGNKRLKVWSFGDDLTSLSVNSSFNLGTSTISDLKECYGYYMVIYDNGTAKTLRQLELANGEITTKRSTPVEQDYIECTKINGVPQYLLWGGQSGYVVLQQNFVSTDAGDGSGWVDADIGPGTDGQIQAVRGCTGTDCQVEYADLDGNGIEELILRNANGIQISGLDEDITLVEDGQIATTDLNEDGAEELLVLSKDGNWIWIYQAQNGVISSVQGVWIDDNISAIPGFADVDGDGWYEMVRQSANRTILTSRLFP